MEEKEREADIVLEVNVRTMSQEESSHLTVAIRARVMKRSDPILYDGGVDEKEKRRRGQRVTLF